MSSRRHFPVAIQRAIRTRADGRCECYRVPNFGRYCCQGLPVQPGRVVYEHIDPWILSRDSSLGNGALLRIECARAKTDLIDAPMIAKVERVRDRHTGIRNPWRRRLPCGRETGLTKPLYGPPQRRIPPSARIRALRARRPYAFVSDESLGIDPL